MQQEERDQECERRKARRREREKERKRERERKEREGEGERECFLPIVIVQLGFIYKHMIMLSLVHFLCHGWTIVPFKTSFSSLADDNLIRHPHFIVLG